MRNRATRRPTASARPGRLRAAAVLALLLSCAGGCAHKAQPVRAVSLQPGEPTATVWNTHDGSVETYLVSVDEKRLPYKRVLFWHETAPPIIVPAGVHRLEVTIDHGNRLTGVNFDFRLEAGHRDQVQRARVAQDQVEVVDLTADRAVRIAAPRRE